MLLGGVVAFEGPLPTPKKVDEQHNANDQYNQATNTTPYGSTGNGWLLVIGLSAMVIFGDFWVGKDRWKGVCQCSGGKE